jgi:hypothetical protein
MALFNAGFDRLPTRDEWSHWVHEFDLLGNPVAQAQAMINAYAPGISDQELVSHLWSMVVGAPITTAALMDFSELLRDGTYTQASLLDIAANHSLNVEELVEVVGTTVTLDAAAFPIPGA